MEQAKEAVVKNTKKGQKIVAGSHDCGSRPFLRLFTRGIDAYQKIFGPIESEDCFYCVVRATGLEPARSYPLDPKSNASANFAMPA